MIDAFGYRMFGNYLPALMVAFKMKSPEEGYEECISIEDSMIRRDCEGAFLAVMNDSDAVWKLRWKLTYNFNELILKNETSGWLREFGFDTNALIRKFEKLVYGLDGKSLTQLLTINSSMAWLALMLRALINDNKELAKSTHTLWCCDLYQEAACEVVP